MLEIFLNQGHKTKLFLKDVKSVASQKRVAVHSRIALKAFQDTN